MILPDYPIENKEQDQLRRLKLAVKVAEMISNFDGKESFVIGIEGKWGSGKTSFINLIKQQIDSNKIICLNFNPWNFSDETSLLRDFFIKLSENFQKITSKKDIGKWFKKYAQKISNINLGISLWGISFNPSDIFNSSLESMRKDLDISLSKVSKKLLIIIDDIDRLDAKETKLILKLVKLTANFPNTIFILAYDRSRVEKRITEEDNGINGGEYLKKIVQVSFTLPLPDNQEMQKILFKDLDETLALIYKEIKFNENENKRWQELFRGGFSKLFTNIRDIKRYISSLRLAWSIMSKEDVNKIDFMGIEAIRVFAPAFYETIADNKDIFTEEISYWISPAEGNTIKNNRYNKLLDLVPEDNRKNIDGICKILFPLIENRQLNSYGEWAGELRICSRERFDYYFQLSVPSGEISETQVDKVVNGLKNQKKFESMIFEFKKEGKIGKLLDRLMYRTDKLDEEKVKNALISFWKIGNKIIDKKETYFDLNDTDSQITAFGHQSIKNLKSNRKNLIKELIDSCQNLYYPAHLLKRLEDELSKYENPLGISSLNKEELEELKRLFINKIEHLDSNNLLENQYNLAVLLYRWKEWKSGDSVKKYIEKLISTKKGLLIFLKSYIGRVLSSNGNYNSISKKSINELYPIEEIEKKVNQVTEEEIKQMNEKEKEAIDLFKNPRGHFD